MRPKITVREEKEEKKKESNNSTPEHPIWKKDVTIPRAFRWTLHPKDHPDVSWWMKRLNTNYLTKTIEMEVYDDAEGKVFTWITDIIQDSANSALDLRHLDAQNKSIYMITFEDLSIVDHTTSYDYKLSDVLTHKLKITYKAIKRINNLNIQ
jgi:hypothetical protein